MGEVTLVCWFTSSEGFAAVTRAGLALAQES